MKMDAGVAGRGDSRCKGLGARLGSAPQNIAQYAEGSDANIKRTL